MPQATIQRGGTSGGDWLALYGESLSSIKTGKRARMGAALPSVGLGSIAGQQLQLSALAAGLNQDGAVRTINFEAADTYCTPAADNLVLLAHFECAIVDDCQGLFDRTGDATARDVFKQRGGRRRICSYCNHGNGRRKRTHGARKERVATLLWICWHHKHRTWNLYCFGHCRRSGFLFARSCLRQQGRRSQNRREWDRRTNREAGM